MLEDVLLPTWVGRHIADQLLADQATFPTFVELLALDSTLAATLGSESQAYTVFAPSEAAFASLGGAADVDEPVVAMSSGNPNDILVGKANQFASFHALVEV
jgi:hypothetical protein